MNFFKSDLVDGTIYEQFYIRMNVLMPLNIPKHVLFNILLKVLSQNAALFYAAYWDKYLLTPHPFDVNLIAFNRDSSINKLLI